MAAGKIKIKKINISEPILKKNGEIAFENQSVFRRTNLLVLNIMSSPGSGKTSLLERTIKDLKNEVRIAVIEGDQQTDRDSLRIKNAGADVYQINTINSCHLDAAMIQDALAHFNLDKYDVLFIENVGNLICPGEFDLGENYRIVVLSISEGEDKPLKYPGIFIGSHVALVNKIDAAAALESNPDSYVYYIEAVNPSINCIKISAKTGEGMGIWYQWLKNKLAQRITL